MDIITLTMIAIGLAMDAFSVSVSSGILLGKAKLSHAGRIGLFFGGFQFFMPCIGWILATSFAAYIVSVDHWIAFGLLGFIGGKMIWEAMHPKEEEISNPLDLKLLTLMAIATSIDALAVGVTFATMSMTFLGGLTTAIIPAAGYIGILTFVISGAGVLLGGKCGDLFGNRAEIAGGLVLVFIGVKILVEHLLG